MSDSLKEVHRLFPVGSLATHASYANELLLEVKAHRLMPEGERMWKIESLVFIVGTLYPTIWPPKTEQWIPPENMRPVSNPLVVIALASL